MAKQENKDNNQKQDKKDSKPQKDKKATLPRRSDSYSQEVLASNEAKQRQREAEGDEAARRRAEEI